jgi:hypothetical protein
MRLADAAFSTSSVFTKTTGAKFRGRLTARQGVSGATPSNMDEQFLELMVRPGAQVAPGEVFRAPSGQHFLIARRFDHNSSEGSVGKVFHAIPMNVLATWQQFQAPTDPTTGLQTTTSYVNHPTTPNVWVLRQPYSVIRDAFDIPKDSYQIISAQQFAIKDRVAGLVIQRVSPHLGVYVSEAK